MSARNVSTKAPQNRFMRNWTSLIGWVVALTGCFAFLLLLSLDFFAQDKSPYLGILTYLIAPLVTAGGLVLAGVGCLLHRWNMARVTSAPISVLPIIDLSRPRDQKLMGAFVATGIFFLMLTSVGTYQAYHVTKSVEFCGLACHKEMSPQFETYQHAAHAKVECTACHIGSDAASFVKAKFNGLHQVYVSLRGTASKPIDGHGKIHINQRTCEQCHWPSRFVGNIDRTYIHYLDDETNTVYPVRLLLKVGGGDPTHGPTGGIHWHMNLANKIEYIATDVPRQKIPWIRLTESDGKVTEFAVPGFAADPSVHEIRRMDCMDCHNRPAHPFRSPNDAVELALSLGKISTNLPAIKRHAVKALTAQYTNSAEALEKIKSSLRTQYPASSDIESAITEVQAIYQHYFFPEMKTDWRTHPNNIGHKDWPGCFRCHDNEHVSKDGGRRINRQDCNGCHLLVAEGGREPANLDARGLKFKHPEEGWEDLQCFDCHTGSTGESK